MPVVLSRDRLSTSELPGGAGTYEIPVGEAEAAARTEDLYAKVGLILALLCVIAGVLAIFGGIVATSGVISLPVPWSKDPITFNGTPVGVVLVVLGLAFFILSRPQIQKVS